MSSVLEIHDLKKNYGRVQALKGVSFSVPKGSVFGILGPNGSGKTTMLGIITDILRPTGGSFTLFGEEPTAAHRRQLGTLLETPNFYHYLSAERNLRIAAQIKQRSEADIPRVLDIVNLSARKKDRFATYSLGMKQRLAIGSALLGNPDVLVLDEPTNGLDPVGIAEIRALIKDLHQQGKTIIMASHLLDEVEKVCTHVAILKSGVLVASGHVDEILAHEDVVESAAADLYALEQALQSLPSKSRVWLDGEQVCVSFPAGTSSLETLNRHCFDHGIILNHLALRRKSLEAKFFELTNA